MGIETQKRIAYAGGFGHWGDVANELGRAAVETVGAAPAYEGEELSGLRAHPSLPDGLRFFKDIDELLREAKPDLVVISTRLDVIPDIILKAAEAGVDIISEKPLGLSLPQLQSVYDAVAANGVKLMPMLSMQTDPVFIKARQIYRAGTIGEATLLNARKSYRYGNRPEWVGDRKLYGGTFPWVGIHAVDIMHFITGLSFKSVAARHLNFAHPERRDCEDNCAAVLELSNGGLATMSLDLMRPVSRGGDDWIRIVGTNGVLEARSNDGVVQLIVNQDEVSVHPAEPDAVDFYTRVLRDDPPVDLNEGFFLTEAVLCARESADQEGTPVQISGIYNDG